MTTKKCPFCAETILIEAIKCKHCGSSIAPGICLKCGKQNTSDAMLCNYCGAENLITGAVVADVSSKNGEVSEDILNALRLILERRRVSQDLLKAHFGSSARATNILSILEALSFIHKPEGSSRWDISFDKIEEKLEQVKDRESAKEMLTPNKTDTEWVLSNDPPSGHETKKRCREPKHDSQQHNNQNFGDTPIGDFVAIVVCAVGVLLLLVGLLGILISFAYWEVGAVVGGIIILLCGLSISGGVKSDTGSYIADLLIVGAIIKAASLLTGSDKKDKSV